MGMLRVLLAISVVFAHCESRLIYGDLAVQLFFVISGYLITTIILSGRYASAGQFLASRALRIFPLYWFVAAITLLTYFLWPDGESARDFFNVFLGLDSKYWVTIIASNVFILGQDVLMFTSPAGSQLHLSGNFKGGDFEVWNGLLVPQAWSLSLELMFYALASQVVLSRSRIVLLLALSLSLRSLLLIGGLGLEDPWRLRFFPSELALFLFGSLSRHYLQSWSLQWFKGVMEGFVYIVWCALLVASMLGYSRILVSAVAIAWLVLTLPTLAALNSRAYWDKVLGELSYPIYIVHFLVISLLLTLGIDSRAFGPLMFSLLSTVVSVVLSLMLLRYVVAPIERQRSLLRRS